MAMLSALVPEIAIPACAVIGIALSPVLWRLMSHKQALLHDQGEDQARRDTIKRDVSRGVNAFLSRESWYVGFFVVAFAILIYLFPGLVVSFSTQSRPCMFDPSNRFKRALATAVAFLLGAVTSVMAGSLGMKIAICANARIALERRNGPFNAAFTSGAVMGNLLAAIGLLVLYIAIKLFKWYYGNDWEGLFEAITGYGLGGSSMALFRRAGGGIYAKAADVCLYLVKEDEPNLPQDRNPAVVPNLVGDIVGDVAGVGTDLFGSYADSSCAALVVASISSFGINHDFTSICYPLLISSMGILVCLITTLFMAVFLNIMEAGDLKPALEIQLIISTILMTVGIVIVNSIALPSSFTIYNFGSQEVVNNWQLSLCVGVGLWAGLLIGFVTKYYPKNALLKLPKPFQDFIAKNISVVFAPVIIPPFAAISICVSGSFAATYGIAMAALGMLGNIAIRLAIDAYGPISDNAQRIAGIARRRALDATDDTTAAIGKGFAIESAALVSIALFGAFVSRAAISHDDVLAPKLFIGFILGTKLPDNFFAMTMQSVGFFLGTKLPYRFSTMTMKSVGRAAMEMAQEVCKQLESPRVRDGRDKLDYVKCIKISTDASFRGMILPGALVLFTPLFVGTVLGVNTLSGVLAGSLYSVVQIAISASNTGGARNQANDDIKAGALEYANAHCRELSEYATRREIIGVERKDTSGPPLNILVQLMAVESLVFARFFATHGGLLLKFF